MRTPSLHLRLEKHLSKVLLTSATRSNPLAQIPVSLIRLFVVMPPAVAGESSESSNDNAVSEPASPSPTPDMGDDGPKVEEIQRLPTKCVGSIDGLVEAVRSLVGEQSTFKIEVRKFACLSLPRSQHDVSELLVLTCEAASQCPGKTDAA